jgi:hypothetical protein
MDLSSKCKGSEGQLQMQDFRQHSQESYNPYMQHGNPSQLNYASTVSIYTQLPSHLCPNLLLN